MQAPVRFIAQDIATREILDWNLPLTDAKIKVTMSGPALITATTTPELHQLDNLNLDERDIWVHAECGGQLRATGILHPPGIESGTGVRDIVAEGFTAYPHGIPYLSQYAGIHIDPVEAVRVIWEHLESYPDAQLGVTVDGATDKRIGVPATMADFLSETGPTDYHKGPYTLNWWNSTDCGQEIANLATSTPFDYTEKVGWNEDHTDTTRSVTILYPRAGRRRDDLSFIQGENMVTPVAMKAYTDYVNFVVGTGKGEGVAKVQSYKSVPTPGRIRRVFVLNDASVETNDTMASLVAEQLRRRSRVEQFEQIIVSASHPNAPVWSYDPGDDILVQAKMPYLGVVRIWHRILDFEYDPAADTVTINIRASDTFSYGYPTSGV